MSERSGKKAQYEIGKSALKNTGFDAGIFIFYDKDKNFRFSFIEKVYLGIRRDFSHFRRYTYFVGEGTNKTFLKQIGEGNFSGLKEIKLDFSVEKVTKEFYLEYHKLFENILDSLLKNKAFLGEISKSEINAENFAKKLLGQIVFLYFIQKKGWLGVLAGGKWGSGNKNFISDLFLKSEVNKQNFYKNYLEKLFYDTLNNSNRGTADPSFSKIFNCRIPFLNGGLFEPEHDWQNSIFFIDNKIFKEIFEVFDRYNFTVEEESPDDKEVAVDPEMLGKVFENLLSENLRKGKGTYYTPREIVYYMCRESLINYLLTGVNNQNDISKIKIEKLVYGEILCSEKEFGKMDINNIDQIEVIGERSLFLSKLEAKQIDQLLKDIKVCDPACGSGAFLVGMLNEIVKVRKFLDEWYFDKNVSEYQLKKETIQNCLYGVDIDPGAIEIAKLRLWLQLVVDYELKDIEPLPNLDYRLMCGNSLLEEFEGVKFYNDEKAEQQGVLLIDTEKSKKVIELQNKVKEYFDIHDGKEKLQKRKEINDIKDWLIRSVLEKRKQGLANKRKEAEYQVANLKTEKDRKKHYDSWAGVFLSEGNIEKVLNNLHNPKKEKPFFLWKLEFPEVFEKGGFDIVTGNPPYIRQEDIYYKPALQKEYEIFNAVSDLYTYFYERGFRLLKDSGTLTFITSSKFLRARYGTILRKYLKENTTIKNIVNFGDQHMFEAITNTLIFIATKQKIKNNTFNYSKNIDELGKIIFPQSELRDSEWTIGNPEVILLKDKIESFGTPLKDWDVIINYGIKTGYNEAYIINEITKNELIKKGPKAKEIIKPIIRGRDIKRYYFVDSGLYFIVAHNGYRTADKKVIPAVDINDYHSIKNHLDKYARQLKERQDKGYTIYNLRDCAFMDDFAKEKIVWLELTNENKFAYSDEEDYLLAGAFFLVGESLKYLLAFLNSKLCLFYFSLICNSSGMATTQWKKFALEKVPIKELSDKEQKPFVEIVDKILAVTKTEDYSKNLDKKKEVGDYEKQIDKMVYGLYNLTKPEIEIIENSTKK